MRVAEPDLTTCRWPAGARLLRREDRGLTAGRRLRAVVAVPARDEAARLDRCLAALADQRHAGGARLDPRTYAAVLLVNNCADASAEVALAAAERLGLGVRVLVARLEGGTAHVGWARRLAMDAAAGLLEAAGGAGDGVVLSTDADSRVSRGWLAAGLGALARGADAAAGPIDGEPEEYAALNRRCRRRCGLQRAYGGLLERLATLVDPEPHDPWPRHFFECGASMAVRLPAYRAVGGLPPLPSGEDGALFRALARRDAPVRHCPSFAVLTSCRVAGRAAGGVADTLARWSGLGPPDPRRDRIAGLAGTLRMLGLRAGLRRAYATGAIPPSLARRLGLAPAALCEALAAPAFGVAWEGLRALVPGLTPRTVPAGRLAGEIARARDVVAALLASADGLGPGAADEVEPVELAA